MLPPFLIDAAALVEFQACRRRFLLSRKWRSLRWRPKLLFDFCLRLAIIELGNGRPARDVVLEATARFMSTGANPGLDISGYDPYKVALDWTAMLETVLYTLSRQPPVKLTQLPSKPLGDGVEWTFLAQADERGDLHRTITVDRLDDDRLSQELHNWYVTGDVCMAKKPMHLHVIEIGQMREGRRHSPWARAFEHEHIAKRIKFQRKGGKELQGDVWRPVFLADSNTWNAEAWVDAMAAEGVAEGLMKEIEVLVPGGEHVKNCIRDVKIEASQMQQWSAAIQNPMEVPMSRAACDSPLPCQFQAVCFAPTLVTDIGGIGLYKPRRVGA
jgi:hypothetical protein